MSKNKHNFLVTFHVLIGKRYATEAEINEVIEEILIICPLSEAESKEVIELIYPVFIQK
ncbi:hypothetical protein [Candidatus Pelagibacter communis]|uniref:hypothetical protein n=1 Tax=Pelagibacter ubique TaxID=198252 RepID=UPI000AC3292A|nr:hypothetical protein [Candidatus Pelagibacter ubique]